MSDDSISRSPRWSLGRVAVPALLLATVFWGCGFTWAKAAGEAANRAAGAGDVSALGPVWVLAIRFLLAGILWLIIFPDARRNWSRSDVWRSVVLGGLLATGLIVQHIGLDRTSEAVSAFLTSLTILFVPMMMTLVLRKPPSGAVWIGVILAGAGVWLMTGASPSGFGLGEILGLACAISYSVDIIAVNALLNSSNAARVTAGQFLVVGMIATATCLFHPHDGANLALLKRPEIHANIVLLALFATIGSFGLQFRFQPFIEPTRAALIYLMEPIFASIYAWVVTGRGLGAMAIAGAGLILVANAFVEIWQSRAKRSVSPGHARGYMVID